MATEDSKGKAAWEAFRELLKAHLHLMRAWELISDHTLADGALPRPDAVIASGIMGEPDSVRQTEPTQTRTEAQSPPAEPH